MSFGRRALYRGAVAITLALALLALGGNGQLADAQVSAYVKCVEVEQESLKDCLGQGYIQDFWCDAAYQVNENRCELFLLAAINWPW